MGLFTIEFIAYGRSIDASYMMGENHQILLFSSRNDALQHLRTNVGGSTILQPGKNRRKETFMCRKNREIEYRIVELAQPPPLRRYGGSQTRG